MCMPKLCKEGHELDATYIDTENFRMEMLHFKTSMSLHLPLKRAHWNLGGMYPASADGRQDFCCHTSSTRAPYNVSLADACAAKPCFAGACCLATWPPPKG